jgi:hypothetical protein
LSGCGKRSKRYTRRSPCSARTRTGSNMGWPRRLPLHNLKELEPLLSHGVWSAIHVHGSPPFGIQPDQDSDRAHLQRTKRKQSKLPRISSTWKLRLDMVDAPTTNVSNCFFAGVRPTREIRPEVQQLEGWKAPRRLHIRLRDTITNYGGAVPNDEGNAARDVGRVSASSALLRTRTTSNLSTAATWVRICSSASFCSAGRSGHAPRAGLLPCRRG